MWPPLKCFCQDWVPLSSRGNDSQDHEASDGGEGGPIEDPTPTGPTEPEEPITDGLPLLFEQELEEHFNLLQSQLPETAIPGPSSPQVLAEKPTVEAATDRDAKAALPAPKVVNVGEGSTRVLPTPCRATSTQHVDIGTPSIFADSVEPSNMDVEGSKKKDRSSFIYVSIAFMHACFKSCIDIIYIGVQYCMQCCFHIVHIYLDDHIYIYRIKSLGPTGHC